MKKVISILGLVLASACGSVAHNPSDGGNSTISATEQSESTQATGLAGSKCGVLREVNVCHSFPGCPTLFLKADDRGPNENAYLVQVNSIDLRGKLSGFAASQTPVCITGIVGANNDPDLFIAKSATAK